MNPVHTRIPISLRFLLILSSNLCLGLPSGLFPSGFATKRLYASLILNNVTGFNESRYGGSALRFINIQSDWKFTQPILKCLLMIAIQYNSSGLINTHIVVTIQEPTHVTSCYNLLAPVRQLSSNSRIARMSFSQVQLMFIVEHYLAYRSYVTCQYQFRDTFPDSPVPNKSTVSRLVNRFRDTRSVQDRNHSDWPSVLGDNSLAMLSVHLCYALDISNAKYNIVLCFLISM
jgi:hypothetical protein